MWLCPANSALELPGSEQLIRRAARNAWAVPSFWVRGIVPADWAEVLAPPTFGVEHVHGTLPAPSLLPDVDGYYGSVGYVAFGDGSGGTHSAHPRFRRCAWGLRF